MRAGWKLNPFIRLPQSNDVIHNTELGLLSKGYFHIHCLLITQDSFRKNDGEYFNEAFNGLN